MADPVYKHDRPPADEAAPPGRKAPARDEAREAPAKPPARSSWGRRLVIVAVLLLIVAGAAAGGVMWWLSARNFESTDDAFVDTRIVSISSQVAGAIVGVGVTDNQLVTPGATMVDIDPRDYQTAVAQATAQVDQAKATIANLDAQIDAQKARIDQAQKQVEQTKAALTFAQQEQERNESLMRSNAGTRQQLQQATSNFIQAQANMASAAANAVATQKQIPVLETQRQGADAQVEQAQAQLRQAEINLSRTRISASEAGRATKISAAIGANAQPGQVLMLFVPENKWVTANFKETQLTLMRPGQAVDIAIDAYPGRTFRGHVDSVQAGSGPAFSLLPPENATGNFVKVVQRVPVKIVFDEPPGVYIGPGMSVVPTVRVR
jgi:membrane fusion protein, multidrug efflux system